VSPLIECREGLVSAGTKGILEYVILAWMFIVAIRAVGMANNADRALTTSPLFAFGCVTSR